MITLSRSDSSSPEEQPPKVKTSVAVCMRILGYRECVERATSRETANSLLGTLRAALDHADEWATEVRNGDGPHWVTRAFTDRIVVGFPSSEALPLEQHDIGTLLLYLAFFQFEMIRAGFFVRGAISVGEFHIDDDIVFGKAFAEANEEERKAACAPRIILAPSAAKVVASHVLRDNPAFSRLQRTALLRDFDDRLFVDYLGQTIFIAGGEIGPFRAELEMHRDRVAAKLTAFKHKSTIWSKYEWAARYHNFFCDLHSFERAIRVKSREFSVVSLSDNAAYRGSLP